MSLYKIRERTETNQICVVLRNLKGADKEKLFRDAYRRGELDTHFHFILSNTGLFEADRDIRAIAGYSLPECETSIYVLADVLNKNRLSDAQKHALNNLKARYSLPIKFVEV